MITLAERLKLAAEIAASLDGISPNVKNDLEFHISEAQELIAKNLQQPENPSVCPACYCMAGAICSHIWHLQRID